MTGIFSIEERWVDETELSAKPMLCTVARYHTAKLVHKVANTRSKFLDYLRSWDEHDSEFCFLHLWFHGSKGGVSVGSSNITFDAILDSYGEHPNNWKNCVVHFGSCSTMATKRSVLREFLNSTELSAVSGYEIDVNWIEPLALESMYLGFLLQRLSKRKGGATPDDMRVVRDTLTNSEMTAGLCRALRFKMMIKGD